MIRARAQSSHAGAAHGWAAETAAPHNRQRGARQAPPALRAATSMACQYRCTVVPETVPVYMHHGPRSARSVLFQAVMRARRAVVRARSQRLISAARADF